MGYDGLIPVVWAGWTKFTYCLIPDAGPRKRDRFAFRGREFVEVTVQQIFDSTNSMQILSVHTKLVGADAALGSMLYAVALLGMGEQAIDALHEHGYDVSYMDGPPPDTCQDLFPAEACTALANQLSRGIDASLAIGADAERDAFLQGVSALGFGPCQGGD